MLASAVRCLGFLVANVPSFASSSSTSSSSFATESDNLNSSSTTQGPSEIEFFTLLEGSNFIFHFLFLYRVFNFMRHCLRQRNF